MNQEREQQLIRQSVGNDTAAFGRLVTEYQYYVFRLAFRLLCNTEEARDATQEVFIRAWTHLAQFKPQVKFTTWLYKITVNLCHDQMRQQRRQAGLIAAGQQEKAMEVPVEEDTGQNLENQELITRITRLTGELTPKQKLVFTLWDLEGIDPEEIKLITGMSSAKIKSNLYLARKYIRQRISKIL